MYDNFFLKKVFFNFNNNNYYINIYNYKLNTKNSKQSFLFLKKELYFFNFFYKNFFSLSTQNYIHYDYYLYVNFFQKHKNNSHFYLNTFFFKNFKNFCNALYYFFLNETKFLMLDINNTYTNNFNNLLYSDNVLIKYNLFFNVDYKNLRKQNFFLFYKNFLVKNKIKLIIILDYEFFNSYLNFFNLLNIYMFSIIPINYNNQYVDFFLIRFSNFLFLEKTIYASYIYNIYNFVTIQQLKLKKIDYYKNLTKIV